MSTSTITTGSLVPRVYGDFRGIDATKRDVSLTRSPDALNMWINYKNSIGKCIETRPSLEKLIDTDNSVYGIFEYKIGETSYTIVHIGTKLYKLENSELTELYTGMGLKRTTFFVHDNILYIKDNLNYLTFNGTEVKNVVGYVPTTSTGRSAAGKGTTTEPVNMLSDYRKNTFLGDGESTTYQLDVESFDNEAPVVYVNDIKLTALSDYTWDRTKGTITFTEAPSEPATTGQDNIAITFKKTTDNRDKIEKCQLLTIFNDSVFVSGNPDYPNVMWAGIASTPNYIADIDYYNEGTDSGIVKAMIAGNNALWVFKESGQGSTTCFYHTPVYTTRQDTSIAYYDYAPTNSSISLGCIGDGINFNDDIVFFSNRGMEGISSDVNTEQALAHRSSLVDALILNDSNYKNVILQEYEGYLLAIMGKNVYLADSRAKFTNNDHAEYDWFYWKLENDITCANVIDGELVLGTSNGIYTLTDNSEDREIESYWTTPEDEFKVGQYQKTTNKKGCVIDMTGSEVTLYTKTDNNDYELIDTYTNTKEYVVARIKKKKWKSIQLMFKSNKPFGLYSCTLQAYVGGYMKR